MTTSAQRILAAAAVVVLLAVAVAQKTASQTRDGTSEGRGPGGYRAMAAYLEARGEPWSSWRRPLSGSLESGDPGLDATLGVLVLTAPDDYHTVTADEGWAVRRFVDRGGVLALLGAAAGRSLDAALGLGVRKLPFDLWGDGEGFWDRAERRVVLSSSTVTERVSARTTNQGFQSSDGDAVWFASEARSMAIRERAMGRGHLVLLDVDPWRNDSIERDGNLDLLERVIDLRKASTTIFFDDWHHGLIEAPPVAADDHSLARPFDLLVLQVAAIWALALFSASRPMGAERALDPPIPSSVDRDLRHLGSLHSRNGHWTQGGQLLLQAARRLARDSSWLPARFEGGAADLLELARAIGRRQKERTF